MTHLVEPDARVYIGSFIAACGALVPRDEANRQIAAAVAHDCPACCAVVADDLDTLRALGLAAASDQPHPPRPDIDRIADRDDSDTEEAEREFENGDHDDDDDVEDDGGDDLIDEC